MHALTTDRLNGRAAARELSTPEHRPLPDPRRWWLLQARACLATARYWRGRFGGPMHDSALAWYLEALVRAERYHRWAHELAPALRQVDEQLEGVS